mmetsp:Transcript_99416/g.176328  ORF Transcript_99416/g.176328 Transcript_99416/m.176328 type:complete len:574 (-) Transcript_99416:19-1740(-)
MVIAKRSREEVAIIQALQVRLQQAQQRLGEAQSTEARASATALAQRTRSRPLSEAQQSAKLVVERLEQDKERSRRYQHKLCSDIEAAHGELQELSAKAREFRGASREAYDGLQEELQGVIDQLAEVCSKNGELRRLLTHHQSPVPPCAIEDRAPWIGLGLAGQGLSSSATLSRDGNAKRRDAATGSSSPVQSEVVTPRPSGAGTPPSARSVAWSSASGIKVRAATAQLQEEVMRMESKVLREQERAASMAQRSEVLRKRERQLEAALQRDREEGEETKQHLEAQLQKSYHQIRMLMELAALPLDDSAMAVEDRCTISAHPHTVSMAAATPSAVVQVSPGSRVEERPPQCLNSGSSSSSCRPISCRAPSCGAEQPSARRAGAHGSGSSRRVVSVPAREEAVTSKPIKQDRICSASERCTTRSHEGGSCDPAGISLADCEEQEAGGDPGSPNGAGGTGGTGGGAPVVLTQPQSETVAERIIRLTSCLKANAAHAQPLAHGRMTSSAARSNSATAQRSCSRGTSKRCPSAKAVSARDSAARSASTWVTPLRGAWAQGTSSTQRRTKSGEATACPQR